MFWDVFVLDVLGFRRFGVGISLDVLGLDVLFLDVLSFRPFLLLTFWGIRCFGI